jgi:hypothetical protein
MTTQTTTAFTWASGGPTSSGTTNPITMNSGGTSGPYAATVFGQVVVAGTATAGAQVQVQERPYGSSTWYSPATKVYTAPLAAGTYSFEIPLDPTAAQAQLVYTQQTGGTSSTFTAELGQVTGL